MSKGIIVEVTGDYALFTRPEMKVERISYDVITPSAARGVIEAVFWHPGLRWIIDRIYVLNPICFTNIRRNEVKSKLLASEVKSVIVNKSDAPMEIIASSSTERSQRAATLLRDVRYVICAHFEMTENAAPSDNEGKFTDIVRRRLEKGQCYSQPYLGTREFPAVVKAFNGDLSTLPIHESLRGERDLGYMLYDMDYSRDADACREPMFFRAKLKDGLIDLTDVEVVQ